MVGDLAGRGERRCCWCWCCWCSVAWLASESESSSSEGRRMVGVWGGGDDEGIVGWRTAGWFVVRMTRRFCYATGWLSTCRVNVSVSTELRGEQASVKQRRRKYVYMVQSTASME